MIDARIGDIVTMPDLPNAARRFSNGDEILGRYVVQSELGQGGMGVVYKCFDKIGGVAVAVKGLPPEVSHNSDEMEAVRENFQLVSELHHPNIAGVRTLEKDSTTGDYYLVMTLARGVSLRHWLRQHGGKEHRTEQLNVLRQIASALDYAHNAEPKHIIHRDVKPENIMVDDGGHVMVLDFGLAAQVRSSLSRVSQIVTSRSGTPAYKSPEQWLAQAQRAPSDQYSLGVIAYQMFAGELPFDSDDLDILKHAVVFDPVPPIPGETKAVNVVLAKVLAKKPQERFRDCTSFLGALLNISVRDSVASFDVQEHVPSSVTLPHVERLRRWVGIGAVFSWLLTLVITAFSFCLDSSFYVAASCAYLGFAPCTWFVEKWMLVIGAYPYVALVLMVPFCSKKWGMLTMVVRGLMWVATVVFLLVLVIYGCERGCEWSLLWSASAFLLSAMSLFSFGRWKSSHGFSVVVDFGLCAIACTGIAQLLGLLRISNNPFGEVPFYQFLSLLLSVIYIVLARFSGYDKRSSLMLTIASSILLGLVAWRFYAMPHYADLSRCEAVRALRSIKIPAGVANIGDSSFSSCRFLRDVDIPHSVTDIGMYAFYDCKALEYVSMPLSVKHIGDGAFCGCESLKYADIPNSVINVGDEAYAECENLRRVSIPSSVVRLRSGVFRGCRALTSVSIPSSVKSIGSEAFEGCSSLMTLEMPSCEVEIGRDAFRNCSMLRTVRSEDPDRTRKLKWKRAGVDVDKIVFEGM